MRAFKINSVFLPFIQKHRYKIAFGGRGSGKSWAIADLLVEITRRKQVRILCARELQNSIGDSVIQLLSDMISRHGYADEFDIQKTKIVHLGTGAHFLFYGIKNNPTKIKSLEGIDICWVEEAENVSKTSWDILIPTIRKKGSEIWISFNPKNILDDTYQRFIVHPPKESICLKVNFDKNPHFPIELQKEMQQCKELDYELYLHIWLGEPVADSQLAIIKPLWISSAIDAHIKLKFSAEGDRKTGFDVADDGDDDNAVCFAHGSVVKSIKTWNGVDVIYSADTAYRFAVENKSDKIIYDSIGVGAGAKAHYNRLPDDNKILVGGFNAGGGVMRPDANYTSDKKNKDMFSNVKSQAWWMLRDRFYNTYRAVEFGDKFKDDEIISLSSEIEDIEYLQAELSRPRVDYDQNGRVKVESKKDMKKRGIPSPNRADALVMCYAPVAFKRPIQVATRQKRVSKKLTKGY